MPYFKSLNILFIHIPKTGGANIENYFFFISKTHPKIENLISYETKPIDLKINNHSLQHLTFKEILNLKNFFDVNLDNLKIFTVVRNPYDRIISDLLFLKLINENNTNNEVEIQIEKYFNNNSDYDNHKTLQFNFILDKDNNINKKIIVIKTESLNQEMKNLGFPDFAKYCNNYKHTKNYYKYLNNESIKMINSYYKKDFEYFNYKML